mmetsp:Transcript_2277/g.2998  ORF Transcript_2277/g.2998 Transcript_2277/m.2998 type:complete len:246 (-) Transcript_2277:28-765(-)|eukprot:CAMPEP_0195007292 /NCGR_PEP_ID=MMETSP0326_2-20130528/7492_1 /TAXON_ID=2866 ORGANISM="Crypthecodinium cohnii, Strain Seligo" /NCGR_SAMPLE_ID=MMETSP0326_2 /ASSEMBLY_ACC=CAM_ASM_000348 /LENGTH=245 /DNA_ID=CAMNT_0040014561 /DNA_START=461 /DNA_END=1198 /DNA_ORIENTATION=-
MVGLPWMDGSTIRVISWNPDVEVAVFPLEGCCTALAQRAAQVGREPDVSAQTLFQLLQALSWQREAAPYFEGCVLLLREGVVQAPDVGHDILHDAALAVVEEEPIQPSEELHLPVADLDEGNIAGVEIHHIEAWYRPNPVHDELRLGSHQGGHHKDCIEGLLARWVGTSRRGVVVLPVAQLRQPYRAQWIFMAAQVDFPAFVAGPLKVSSHRVVGLPVTLLSTLKARPDFVSSDRVVEGANMLAL